MSYVTQYKQLFKKGRTISKNNIKPRRIYKISSYSKGDPMANERFVFVVGIVENKIHCLKLNDIQPKKFITFLNKIRDKRKPIDDETPINELLLKFDIGGSRLFEQYIKKDINVYSKKLNSYRVYREDRITTIAEIQFEEEFLREIFNEKVNETIRDVLVEREIDEKDG